MRESGKLPVRQAPLQLIRVMSFVRRQPYKRAVCIPILGKGITLKQLLNRRRTAAEQLRSFSLLYIEKEKSVK